MSQNMFFRLGHRSSQADDHEARDIFDDLRSPDFPCNKPRKDSYDQSLCSNESSQRN